MFLSEYQKIWLITEEQKKKLHVTAIMMQLAF